VGRQRPHLEEAGQQRRAGGGDRLAGRPARFHRQSEEQLQHRRRRHRQAAVGGGDEADPQLGRRRQGAWPAEQLQRHHRAADVDDRVDRPDLVEMDLLHRAAVHPGLGPGQALEEVARGGPGSRRQAAPVDHRD